MCGSSCQPGMAGVVLCGEGRVGRLGGQGWFYHMYEKFSVKQGDREKGRGRQRERYMLA